MDDWLMEEPGEGLFDRSAAQKLLGCPNISPLGEMPAENVKDGATSQFALSISDEDFNAVLEQADILYRHASYVMTLLPKGDSTKQRLNPKQKFLNDLPLEFTRQEALELSKRYELNENVMDKLLGKMIKNGELIKIAPGYYKFCSNYKE